MFGSKLCTRDEILGKAIAEGPADGHWALTTRNRQELRTWQGASESGEVMIPTIIGDLRKHRCSNRHGSAGASPYRCGSCSIGCI